MGCGGSKPNEVDGAAKARSDAIEKQLKQAERDARQDIKLLFLGAGGVCSLLDSSNASCSKADSSFSDHLARYLGIIAESGSKFRKGRTTRRALDVIST